jgi:lipid II:glycine glycyltransferase (peptidoglycan interpeptide bridge formation enzyme)
MLKNIEPVNLAACNAAGSFLQSGFWGSFKARFGWNARPFMLGWEGGTLPLLLIRRRLVSGFSFAYVPWGPELPKSFSTFPEAERQEVRLQSLKELAAALRYFLPKDTAFIRFDPPWYSQGAAPPVIGGPFIRAGADVQPPDTVLLDLEPSRETILGAMKPKWRYNVGLAAKKGVTVRRTDFDSPSFNEDIGVFYRLLRETAVRDGIAIHGIEYYRTLFTHAREYAVSADDPAQNLGLYLAEYSGETLAAIVTLFRGREGVYLYGASSNSNRNLMAPYALQWKAIEDAKAQGCQVYDFFGIPPNDESGHPMAGLYRFKTGFIGNGGAGGKIIHRPGSWDYSYRPLVSGIFTAAERLRKKLRNLKKKHPNKGESPAGH